MTKFCKCLSYFCGTARWENGSLQYEQHYRSVFLSVAFSEFHTSAPNPAPAV